MEGFQYTWVKHKGKHDAIEDKVGSGFATFDWMNLFSNFKLINGVTVRFDHSPILLHLHATKKIFFHKKLCLRICGFLNLS